MIKKTKTNYTVVMDCKYANVLDYPEKGAPVVCQFSPGEKIEVISKDKKYYKVKVSPSVTGYLDKDFIKVK